ncbi:unnamed protein product, partial [Discosporangium mesarthrocarpum]
ELEGGAGLGPGPGGWLLASTVRALRCMGGEDPTSGSPSIKAFQDELQSHAYHVLSPPDAEEWRWAPFFLPWEGSVTDANEAVQAPMSNDGNDWRRGRTGSSHPLVRAWSIM